MPESYVEEFHKLPEDARITYHLDALDQGLSLDEALLLDSKILAAKKSLEEPEKSNSLTNLHISSPKRTD